MNAIPANDAALGKLFEADGDSLDSRTGLSHHAGNDSRIDPTGEKHAYRNIRQQVSAHGIGDRLPNAFAQIRG